MVEGVESVGEAVTGGLIARAVEPDTGEAEATASTCLNCGAALVGAYCHRCGQPGHIHRTLTAWWHDLAHGVLHLDGKIWRTLPLLAWKPGELTRRYIEGERARFVSPIALFLFSVFLMFAVFNAIGGPVHVESDPAAQAQAAKELSAEMGKQRTRIAEMEAERQRLLAAKGDTREIDANLREAQRELSVLSTTARIMGKEADVEAKADAAGDRTAKIDLDTGWAPLDAAIQQANANPSLLFYKIQSNAYKYSWALIPISVPFLWLLFFWKREYRLYDHTVFVTYSIAFMSLGLVALTLLRPIGLSDGLVVAAILLVPPVHMYRQLRGAYGLSKAGALWRTLLLLNFAFMAAGLFFVLLVGLGAMA